MYNVKIDIDLSLKFIHVAIYYSIPLPNPSSLHTTVASLTENLPSSSETGRNVVSTLHTSTSPSFTDAPPRRGTGVRRTLLS